VRSLFLSFFCFIFLAPADAQTFSCASVYTDLAGESAPYEGGIVHSDTLTANAGYAVQLNFSAIELAALDTLFLIDPLFPDNPIAIITNETAASFYQSFGPTLIANFVSHSIDGAEGWIASVSCIESTFMSSSINGDTLCAGFEGFYDWDVLFPFPSETQIIYELSDVFGNFDNPISIGESFVNDDSMYVQLGADLSLGNFYLIRFRTNNPIYDSLTFELQVLVRRLPDQPIIAGLTQFCGDTIELSVPTQERVYFQWYLNDEPINGAVFSDFETSLPGTYLVGASNGCGIVNSSNFSLNYIAPPTIPLLSSNSTILCPNDTLAILLMPSADTSAIAWFNGSNELNTTGNELSITQSGNYFLRRSNFCGTVYSDTILISQVPMPPVSTIQSIGNTQFCEGNSVVLLVDSTVQCTPTWLLNSNPVSSNFSYQANAAGTYHLELSNDCGTSTSANQINLEVLPQPIPAVLSAAGPTTLCEGNSVLLLAETFNGDNIQWYNSGVPIGTQPQFPAVSSGTYTAVTSNSCGTASVSNTIPVQINPLPPVPIIFNLGNPALCNGSTVNLFVNQLQDVTYTWKKNGSFFSSGSGSILVSQPGVFSISATNSCGTVTSEQSISVTTSNPPTVPTITANGATTFCEGLSVTLQTTPQNGTLFNWKLNGNPIGTNNFSIQATQAGTYTLEISNACDTVVSINTIQVNLNPLPPITTISPNTEQSICEGESIVLSIQTLNGVSYQWRRNGAVAGQNQPQITVSTEGIYSLILANTCGTRPASNTVMVNVDSIQPVLQSIIPQPGTALCPGGYVLLNAQPVPFQTYSWYLNGEIIPGQMNPVLEATQWGSYSVQANNACGISSESNSVNLGPGDAPSPFSIYTSGGQTVCSNNSLELTAQVAFGVGIRWYLNGELYAEGPAQIHVNESGMYSAQGYNGCGEANATNTMEITVLAAPEIPTISLNNNILSTEAIGTIQWYNSALEPISGATSISFMPALVNAAYYVSVTNLNGCTAISAPFNFIVNGLEEINLKRLYVYPNPAGAEITIEGLVKGQLIISDLSGKIVFSQPIESNHPLLMVSTNSLANGIYLVSNNARHTKLIVN
jgi:hypothetical protein